MAGLGELNVKVGLDAAEFTRGLTRAERDAQRFQANLVRLGARIGTALGVGFVAASTAIGVLTKKSIDAQDKLLDLSLATGVAVEKLGGIGFAASQAGSDLDSVASSFGKLNVRIAEAARGEKAATEAFKALGIAVKDAAGNTRSADAIFKDVATAFEGFEDGPEKAALGMALFGKSYQQMLPLLADGGKKLQENIDYFNKYGGITTETAKKSSEFNDTLGKLSVQAQAFGNHLVKELIGPLQTVADEMLRAAEQTDLLKDAAKAIGETFVWLVDKIANLATWLRVVGIYATEFKSKIRAIQEFDFPGSARFDAITRATKEDVKNALGELDRFKRVLQNATAPRVAGIGLENLDALDARLPKRRPPRLPGSGTGSRADEAARIAKKQLDDQLSALDNFARAEQRLLDARNTALDRLYNQDRISIASYFEQRSHALDKATFETAGIYNEQIALLEDFYKRTKDQTTKLETLTKIGDLKQKRSEFLGKASDQATKDFDAATKAARDYPDSVSEVTAKVLELANTEEAAAQAALIRFEKQNRDLLARAGQEGDAATEDRISSLRERVVLEARINKIADEGRRIQEELSAAETKLQLERDLGLRGEHESLLELEKLRKTAVADLSLIAARWQDVLQGVTDPQLRAALERFKLGIQEISASAEVLANKFRNEVKESFSGAFEGLLNDLAEGKNALDSFKDAFKNFANDIIRNVNRIAAQSVTDALFKSSSTGGGGWGDIITSLFSGLFGGGQDLTGVHAGGNPFVQRDGMAYLHRGERVVTAQDNRSGGRSAVINISMPAGSTPATMKQAGAAVARQLAVANRRLN